MFKSVDRAVKKAIAKAIDALPSLSIATVTSWSSPRATITIGGTSIPKVRATRECWSNMAPGVTVVVLVHGSLSIIIGTI